MRRFLGELELFPIGLGAMPLSLVGRPHKQEALRVIMQFIEYGGNFIDTADVYGIDERERGHNEKLVREGVKQDNIIISTKGGATRPNGGWSFIGGGNPHHLRQTCEQSLVNLRIDQHDLYYLHGPDKNIPYQDSISELVQLKEEGKIRYIGISNVDLAKLNQASYLTSISAVQNRCNPFCKADLYNGVMDFCIENNIAYIPYCPLGGWSEHFSLVNNSLISTLTKKYHASYYEICLAWLLQLNKHIIPIPGMDHPNQVMTNFKSLSLQLEAKDLALMNTLPDMYSPIHNDG